MSYRKPPPGWTDFGTHVDEPGPLEFSGEDEAGMPLWERRVCEHGVPMVSALGGDSTWCVDCFKTGGPIR